MQENKKGRKDSHKTHHIQLFGSFALIILILLNNISLSSATEFDIRSTLPKRGYVFEDITLAIEIDAPEDESVKLLSLVSNQSVDLYFLNQSEFGSFLEDDTFQPIDSFKNITQFQLELKYSSILANYGLTPILDGDEYKIKLYFLVINPSDESDVYLRFQLDYDSLYLGLLENAAKGGLILMMGILALFLNIRSLQFKREREFDKRYVAKSYSYAMFFAFVNYAIWEVERWIKADWNVDIFPNTNIGGEIWLTLIPDFNGYEVVQVLYFSLLGLNVAFLNRPIEKLVKNRKNKLFSNLLIGISFSMLLSFILPIFDLIFFLWVCLSLINLFEFISVYLQIMIQNSGIIRLKSIMMVVGITIAIFMGIIRGNQLENLPADLISILGVFLVYYANE